MKHKKNEKNRKKLYVLHRIGKYFILKFKFDRNFYNFLKIHFKPFPSDKKIVK